MSEPIDGGGGEQSASGEGLVPFGEVETAGDDSGGLLVAFGDEIVQSCHPAIVIHHPLA